MARRAVDNPVSTGAGELSPEHFPAPQRPAIDMADALVQPLEPIITETEGMSVMSEDEAKRQYMAQLAFNEQPVTVVIPRGNERNAPSWVPCSVNGVGPEVWNEKTKQWIRFQSAPNAGSGWLPVNRVITVKRKYLEVLARSRRDEVRTREVTNTPLPNQDGFVIEMETVQAAPFTVRFDPAGADGQEWYRRVMTEA
jgi:hypothetical protein